MQVDVEKIRKEVGKRIKIRRIELDINQRELAKILGICQTHVSEWEAGRRPIRVEHIIQLTHVLKMTSAQLLGEESYTLQ